MPDARQIAVDTQRAVVYDARNGVGSFIVISTQGYAANAGATRMPDQYQKEIEDILRKAEDEAPLPSEQSRRSLRGMVWQYARQSLNSKAWGVSPGKIMLAALVVFLAGMALRYMIPALGMLMWAGLIIFIIGYGMVFLKPSKSPQERKMWRGKYIDDEPSGGSSWRDRFRRKR